jgi:DNA-binding MarR family transcriptional regulator
LTNSAAAARIDGRMDDPDLLRLLLAAHRSLATELDQSLEERGYPEARPGHVAVLRFIDRRSGTRLTELAERAGMTKQAMMQLVDDLESHGFVRRVADPDDGRAKMVRLTARGRRFGPEARRALQAVEGRARRGLGDRRYEQLRAALADLVGEEEPEE